MPNKINNSDLPRHIAIIMDGNGRWAKRCGLPRALGHSAGVKNVRKIVETCVDLGIEVLTLYAFSTENWVRPSSEINALMILLEKFLHRELPNMMKNNIQLRTIGDISRLPEKTRKTLNNVIKQTQNNTGLKLNLALNYGGRQEIVRAINRILENGIKIVDENVVDQNLDTAGLPEPDLLIRTSGEMRISNFLLWQIAYSELYVTSVLWPDFKPKNLLEAVEEYKKRERRFGGI